MLPQLPVATDNFHKFRCLFWLAIVVTSLWASAQVMTAALNRQSTNWEALVNLEEKQPRTAAEDRILELRQTNDFKQMLLELLSITCLGVVVIVSYLKSLAGFDAWESFQLGSDQAARLQMLKTKAEVAKLRAETAILDDELRRLKENATPGTDSPASAAASAA